MTPPAGGPRLLVVGADTDAGRSFARLGQQRGARVVSATRPVPEADHEAELERAFAAAEAAEAAPPDAVVYVLALAGPGTRVTDMSLHDWEATVITGLRGAFLAARRAVEEFLAGGSGGRLGFLACGEGAVEGVEHEVVRTALRALVRSVAKEYGPRAIGCNAVFAPSADPVCAREAAEAMWLLVTPEGAYVTGEMIDLGADARS